MSIPIEYAPALVGVVFGVFGLVLVWLDERRFDREMRDARPASRPRPMWFDILVPVACLTVAVALVIGHKLTQLKE